MKKSFKNKVKRVLTITLASLMMVSAPMSTMTVYALRDPEGQQG